MIGDKLVLVRQDDGRGVSVVLRPDSCDLCVEARDQVYRLELRTSTVVRLAFGVFSWWVWRTCFGLRLRLHSWRMRVRYDRRLRGTP